MKNYRANIIYLGVLVIILIAISTLKISFSPVASYIIFGVAITMYFFIVIKLMPKDRKQREMQHYIPLIGGVLILLVKLGTIYKQFV